MTESEYLAFERASEIRHEYAYGQLYAMAGARREHNLICTNLVARIHPQLQGKPCEIYQSDMRVKVSAQPTYRYPDVVVVCGEPQFSDDSLDMLLNPTLLVEVVSPSSAETDFGIKAYEYRQLPSLTDYLIVARDAPRIERYQRQDDDRWVLSTIIGMDNQIEITSLACTISLAEIYDRIIL